MSLAAVGRLLGLSFRNGQLSLYHIPRRNECSQPGSAKLFADAVQEEAEQAKSSPKQTITPLEVSEHENWTGEESMRDAVLRMLVDKYKPLRVGTIRTADEKLKEEPPRLYPGSTTTDCNASPAGGQAEEPLLPSIEGHKPWHTTFKPPSLESASVRFGHFSPIPSRHVSSPSADVFSRNRGNGVVNKNSETVGRLIKAKESTLDYRLGIQSNPPYGSQRGRRNPVSLKGWTNMIETKIEGARMAGYFNTVQGRGKPLVRHHDEGNPFIAREEFILNRIVQRNGATPPWIEVQHELESAVAAFREILRQSWTRRVVRILSSQTTSHSPTFTLTKVKLYRDTEWEDRERSYHDIALAELNDLVRKYNTLAPYVVRRPYYTRDAELEKVFQECAEDVFLTLAESVKTHARLREQEARSHTSVTDGSGSADFKLQYTILDAIRSWFARLLGSTPIFLVAIFLERSICLH